MLTSYKNETTGKNRKKKKGRGGHEELRRKQCMHASFSVTLSLSSSSTSSSLGYAVHKATLNSRMG
jgi:hypothetical protein